MMRKLPESLSENALLRRQLKLVMAGKMKLSEADELKEKIESGKKALSGLKEKLADKASAEIESLLK
jgi:hypothetical protein